MEDDLIAPNFAHGRMEQFDGSTLEAPTFRFSNPDPRTLWWEPKDDITVYELARCMPLFVAGTAHMHGHLLQLFDGLPSECGRHWRVAAT